ncbi:MAG: enoyl-CoA hydratase-related protein [Gammaproteobacteria bacterium]|nr:enoyl-CoA hydratase-related protein [Gammaproteobacteria bacterium]
MYDNYESLNVSRNEGILTIEISNPTARNAVNASIHSEMPRIFSEIATDKETRVVVLTGDPAGKAFCAGGDIGWIQQMQGSGEKFAEVMKEGADVLQNIVDLPQPVIAMVNGHAMGLGATLALHCDVVFMDDKAKIADPHVNIGVVAGDGGAVIWPLLIGPNRAKEFLMTGDPLTGAEAAEIGLVNHAVPTAALKDAAYAFAKRMASGPRLAIELTKRSVNLTLKQVLNQTITASLCLEGLTFNSADHFEAVRAFLAKEQPRFGLK